MASSTPPEALPMTGRPHEPAKGNTGSVSKIDQTFRPVQPFYRSVPMPCPYLPNRMERKLFTRLDGNDGGRLNSRLARIGFRRSHDVVYRPVCQGCQACIPVRIPVDRLREGRSLARVRRRNEDLSPRMGQPQASGDTYALFHRYQQGRHADSEMARMTGFDFSAMVEEGAQDAFLLTLVDAEDKLIGAMLADRLEDGFSAVYSFFDPDRPRRSLGTQLVLALVDRARAEGLAYVYLGYWIEGSGKMAYKTRFRPLEALIGGHWGDLPATDEAAGTR